MTIELTLIIFGATVFLVVFSYNSFFPDFINNQENQGCIEGSAHNLEIKTRVKSSVIHCTKCSYRYLVVQDQERSKVSSDRVGF